MAGKNGRTAVCYGAEKYQWPAKIGMEREESEKWTSKQPGESTRGTIFGALGNTATLWGETIFLAVFMQEKTLTCAIHDK
jgi:hypothetical protein